MLKTFQIDQKEKAFEFSFCMGETSETTMHFDGCPSYKEEGGIQMCDCQHHFQEIARENGVDTTSSKEMTKFQRSLLPEEWEEEFMAVWEWPEAI